MRLLLNKAHLFLATVLIIFTETVQAQTVTYTESLEDIVNPDRGFYSPYNGTASSFNPLSASDLANIRTAEFTPWNGEYSVKTSVILRLYILDSFVNTDVISDTFLDNVQADFDAAREAGVRIVLRFAYTITAPSGDCGNWICPPYGDAPKSRVLAHIEQLKPYLQANEDVILVLQNGFIGVWGEQYYSDYFGDPSAQGGLTSKNWEDRIEVLEALLDALPNTRIVQVRVPQMKQKYVYGADAPITSLAMTATEAHNGSDIARIGFHNDCFLADSNDQGTYTDYDIDSPHTSNIQTSTLKAYAAEDSQYNGQGGETCSDTAFSPENDCDGQAVSDMNLLNYSYLNSDYNNDVNNDWETDGCMDEIKRRLGYRFVMQSGTYPTSAVVDGNASIAITIENVGFASPINQRSLQLIMRNTATDEEFKIDLTGSNSDIRFWSPGTSITLNEIITLPTSMTSGEYALYLHVKDDSNNGEVASRSEYSIQFANTGTWESTTGYNNLNHTIFVSSEVSNTAPDTPENLSAVASFSQIDLSWSTSSTAESYSLERATSSGGTYTEIASGLTSVSYSDTELSEETIYYYIVKATNTNGTSEASSEANATTLSPSLPDTPEGLSTSVTSTSQIDLSWNASDGAETYSIKRSESSGGNYSLITSGLTTTTFSNTELSASTTYYYVVTATNTNGTSEASTEANATTKDEEKVLSTTQEKIELSQISVYPNPVTNTLQLKFNMSSNEEIYAEIIGMDGKVYFKEHYWLDSNDSEIAINIEHLSRGIVILRVHMNETAISQTVLLR